MTRLELRWINIEPGLIGLDGYPIEIRRNRPSACFIYTLSVDGRESPYLTLAAAKLDGEEQARELAEFDLA